MKGTPRAPWTPEQDKKLRALVLSASSVDTIAKALNRTTFAVRRRANTLRLPLKKIATHRRMIRMIAGASFLHALCGRYRGAWRPGEFSHSLMCVAVSICLAFLRRSSRSGPGFSWDAFFSRRAFCSANRSWNVWGCERERSMRLLLSCLVQAGACSTLSHRWMPVRGGDG